MVLAEKSQTVRSHDTRTSIWLFRSGHRSEPKVWPSWRVHRALSKARIPGHRARARWNQSKASAGWERGLDSCLEHSVVVGESAGVWWELDQAASNGCGSRCMQQVKVHAGRRLHGSHLGTESWAPIRASNGGGRGLRGVWTQWPVVVGMTVYWWVRCAD